MFSPCSLGWWQFVNSLFISQLLEQKHLSILASPMWTPPGQKREHRNYPQPRSTSSDGSSPSPRPASAVRMVGLAFMKAAKQPFFPFPWISPVVSQPVRAFQLIKAPDFSGQTVSYIGCRKTLSRPSLVSMKRRQEVVFLVAPKVAEPCLVNIYEHSSRYWQLLQKGGS